ncbi:hypothetical protein [Desulfofundulus thermobenzoicus]|nr:hypothetical protein [Desulfofundulus thermobenzoicus]
MDAYSAQKIQLLTAVNTLAELVKRKENQFAAELLRRWYPIDTRLF